MTCNIVHKSQCCPRRKRSTSPFFFPLKTVASFIYPCMRKEVDLGVSALSCCIQKEGRKPAWLTPWGWIRTVLTTQWRNKKNSINTNHDGSLSEGLSVGDVDKEIPAQWSPYWPQTLFLGLPVTWANLPKSLPWQVDMLASPSALTPSSTVTYTWVFNFR